ncbi:MAG: hypothetical protein RIT38_23 [Bacteroidota bacterium]|jgi:glycosyltransferase involved in cell wall biosynthesis
MKRLSIYSPVSDTLFIFLSTTLSWLINNKQIEICLFSNPKLSLGFDDGISFDSIFRKNISGDNTKPFSLLKDLYFLIRHSSRNILFNGSSTIILALFFKILMPWRNVMYVMHGTLKSKGRVINSIFLFFFTFASIIGVYIYSVNNAYIKYAIRRNRFIFLGNAGVGLDKKFKHLLIGSRHNVPINKVITLGFVGRYEVSKGFDFYNKLSEIVDQKKFKCVSIGAGSIIPSNKISDFGFMDKEDLYSCLKNIDILILPSLSEGLGMVMVECCVAGIPTITSLTDGSVQFIRPNETGIIVPHFDLNKYNCAINEMANNLEQFRANCIVHSDSNNCFDAQPIKFALI